MCSKFNPERDIPNHKDKVVLVTGGNSGIGYETVKQLLLKNATVYLAARSPQRGAEAIEKLKSETKKQAIFLELDLADLKSVRRAAEEFLAKESRLDILFNNGGVMNPPVEQLTAQGYDLPFGTNVIGHFFLTELLLPALTASYREIGVPARIINVSSTGHSDTPGTGIDFRTLKGGPERDAIIKKWASPLIPPTWKLYGASKMGNMIVSNYYTQTYPEELVSCSLHPGYIRSGLQRHHGAVFKGLTGLVFTSPAVGAHTQLWAGTKASPSEINGKYFTPVGVETKADPRVTDRDHAAAVMAYLKEQVREF
ncbi:NAD(P)-binding protein [Mycena rebaudengoi]|nr:NAD(P)-binding protein [Mycena rebaudengoi]